MRWKGIYLLLGLVIFFGVIGVFFLDTIIDWSIERSLETIVGAKADVEKLHLSLRDLSIEIGNLQIANPKNTWRNLIETSGLRLQLAGVPLLWGKVIITEIRIADLKLNSARKTDGKLKRPLLPGPFGEAQAKLHRDIAAAPLLDTEGLKQELNPDKLLASYRFETHLSADQIRADLDNTHSKWENNLTKLENLKTQLAQLHTEVAEIKETKLENIADIQKALQQLKQFQTNVKDFQTQVSTTRQNLKTDFDATKKMITDLKETAENDFRALKKLAKLPDFESANMAEMLFGEALLNASTVLVDLMDKLQAYMPKDPNTAPKEKHPRGGVDIPFPGHKTYPRFLIQQITIAGQGNPGSRFDGYAATGTVTGITNDPVIYGRPLTISLDGKAANQARLDLDGTINQNFRNFAGDFRMKLGQLPVPELQLPENRYLPAKIATGNGEVITQVKLRPGYFKVDLTFNGRELVGDYSGRPAATDLGTEIIREVLAKIDLLLISYQLEGQDKKLRMKISSNIDEVISARFKAVIGAKVEQFLQTLRNRVEAELRKKQSELEAIRAKYESELTAKITAVQTAIEKQKTEIDLKKEELEEELKAKTKINLPVKLPKLKF